MGSGRETEESDGVLIPAKEFNIIPNPLHETYLIPQSEVEHTFIRAQPRGKEPQCPNAVSKGYADEGGL